MEINRKYKIYFGISALILMFLSLILRLIKGNLSIPLKWSPYFLSQYDLNVYLIYLISIVLCLLSIILIYFTLKNINFSNDISFLTIILIVISPTFIYLYMVPSYHIVVLFLVSLSAFLLTFKNKYINHLGFISLLLVIQFGEAIIVSLLFLLFYLLWFKRYIIMNLILVIVFAFFYFSSQKISLFFSNNYFITLISDFGGFTGFSLAICVLAFIGVFLTKNVKIVSLPLILVITFFVLSIYDWHYLIYALPFMCLSASKVINLFLSKKWEVQIIKKATLLIMLCTLLFSSVSYSERIAYAEPSNEMIDSLGFIKGLDNGNVLTSSDNQFLIEYYGEKNVLLNYHDEISEIFMTKNLRKFDDYIDSNNVRYVWITPEMKKEIWNNEEDGIYYLLNEYDKFELLSDIDGYEVWVVGNFKN